MVEDLLKLMHEFQADYTNTFLDLTFGRFQASPSTSQMALPLGKSAGRTA